ncbi:hypothetical protein [Qipengyuania nanhaisediminis]|uniref:Uncharacterized protein n=1 Tax=Qipengyuania nanhaisediminis TaxID=604088 RepID=A0A1I5NKF3_9SPHN|nr:hypothetical protein [Qipengyuania nanhaisediminis]SFP22197.1 hypothetical protein SAMN04488060_1918 [Qipengyuania nanhaisediminis]
MKYSHSFFAAILALIASPFLISASSASAQATPAASNQPVEEEASEDAEVDQNEVDCRRIKVTGSRVRKKKICMTFAQWEAYGRNSRNAATEMQDAGSIDPAGDPGP